VIERSVIHFSIGAQVGAGSELDLTTLLVTLFGGLALFLLGLEIMSDALKVVAGDRLRSALERLTANRFMAVVTGAGVTALIQSSSVTTVLVVGFITSGLMTLQQSIPVIMGANLGTTITAQIIAFQVTDYALAFVAIGFFGTLAKSADRKAWGNVVMGLGLIFFGMAVMSNAMSPLRSYEPFIEAMLALESPLLGILVGAAFTALVQSSSATTGIVIVMASQGLIPLGAGIALIIGANVGTSVTAILAAIGKPREAQRAALVHVVFNVGGALIWVWLIGPLASFLGSSGGDVGRQIANAHTVFNVSNLLVFIWFTPRLASIVIRLLPERPEREDAIVVKYLDDELLKSPSLALDRARLELLRMADRVRTMLLESLPAVLSGSRSDLMRLQVLDDEVDLLYGHIITYLGRIGQTELAEPESEELLGLMDVTNNLESIGDVVETNMTALGLARIEQRVTISQGTRALLEEFHHAVCGGLDLAMVAVTQRNRDAAIRVGAMKDQVNNMERDLAIHQAERLVADEPRRLETYRLEMDIIANLKRVYYFIKRTARVAVPVQERVAD
jgi:phosphate:Na+ symporter